LLQEPASGYDVKKQFDGSLRNFWRAELSQIYPQLQKLEKEGFLKSEAMNSNKGPMRVVYECTAAGRRELHDWISGGPAVGAERIGYLAQIYFLAELNDADAALDFLRQLHDYSSQWLTSLKAIEAGWASADPRYPDELPDSDFYPSLTLGFGICRVSTTVDWCESTMRRIEARRAGS
jgi:DNA-binding PadR family transcriptional regulator